MDENASHALRIAAGLVMAVIIISVLVYFFRRLTPFQQNIDDLQSIEPITEFNKTFLAYDKDLMYGADIISVLNKAANINNNYITQYTSNLNQANQLRDDGYLIDIILSSKIELTQTIQIFKIKDFREVEVTNFSSLSGQVKNDIKSKLGITNLQSKIQEGTINANTHLLVLNADRYAADGVEKCVNENIYDYIIGPSASEPKRIVRNKGNVIGPDKWSKAILETYVYEFRTKKFRCTDIQYSTETAKIISMTFEEIK